MGRTIKFMHSTERERDLVAHGSIHREVLESAAAQISSIGPRFIRTVKAQMMRDIEVPKDIQDLGASQMWVIHLLTRSRLTTSELARVHNVTDPTMTRVVDGLVEKKLVERHPHESDRRRTYVQLTERGAEMGAQLDRHFHEAVVEFLSPLSDDQLRDIVRAYQHLASLLPECGGSAVGGC